MTKDEIYNHLAQVYLGKRNKIEPHKKSRTVIKKKLARGLSVAVLLVAIPGLTTTYLSARHTRGDKSITYALSRGPVRIVYDVRDPYPQIKSFSMPLPQVDAARYEQLCFSIRGAEYGYPGVVKVVIKNRKNETDAYYVRDVAHQWQKVAIPLAQFRAITDWSAVTDVTFVVEAWNAEKKKGTVLIDDLSFSG